MKMKIARSAAEQLSDFAGMVAAHAADMKTWRAHMARVKQDEAEGVVGISRHVPYGKPTAHPLVESAVDENDEANFEIVEDGPTDEERLQLKKNYLTGEVTRAEQAAMAAIVSPAKVRLFNLIEGDIRRRDRAIVDSITKNKGPLKAAAEQLGILKGITGEEISAAVNAKRSDEDQAHLAKMKTYRKKIEAVERAAAQAHADIDDLTVETIDAWQVPDFSNII